MASAGDQKKPTIIIIEDDTLIIELVSALLEDSGYHVVAFESGGEAIEKIDEIYPVCIITDLMLPGVSGIQVVKTFRDNPNLADTRIIVVTAKTFEFDKRQVMKLGADAFITKPIDPDKFSRDLADGLISILD